MCTRISRALMRVANDRHDCQGRLLRAIAWGATWSAAYIAPLAVVVYGVHAVLGYVHR